MEVMLTTRVFLQGPDGYWNPVAVAQRSVDMPCVGERQGDAECIR